MNREFAVAALVIDLMTLASSASALRKRKCQAARGTWASVNIVHGRCTVSITARTLPKDPEREVLITKTECDAFGGTVSADGKRGVVETTGKAARSKDMQNN